MGIYAPERAGDVGGALPVMGADADMMPASSRVGRMCLRGVGNDLSDRRRPTRQREDDFEPKVGAVNRRHRPTLVLRTNVAESRSIELEVRPIEADEGFDRCAPRMDSRKRRGCSSSTGEIQAE
jgi:hypothetical protein